MIVMTEFEYAYLTDSWKGPRGAAYNACHEFCHDFGWCDNGGKITDAGIIALDNFEKEFSLTNG